MKDELAASMIERVAKAIITAARHGLNQMHPDDAVDYARAALEAMREPTEAMTSIILQQGYGGVDTHEHVADIWRPMIDTALLENADAQV